MATITENPPIAITVPIISLSNASGKTIRPAKNAAGTEPAINQRNSREIWMRHRVIELRVENTLKMRPPSADCPAVNPISRRIAVKVEPPAKPAIV